MNPRDFLLNLFWQRKKLNKGGRSGLVVMGGDSCSERRGHHILDGQFSKCICCKNCNDEKTENK